MRKQRQHLSFFIGLAALCVSQGAPAIGWGRAPQSAVLGHPLDFNVSLRLDPGDVVAPECVHADVTVGDQRLQPGAVRLGVDTSRSDSVAVRVLTQPAIEEPVVAVNVAIGCPVRMSRRFVLLADPPSLAPAAAPPVSEARVAAVPEAMTRRAAETPARAAPPAEPRRNANRQPAPPRKARKPAAPAPVVAAQPADPTPRLRLDAAEPPPAASGPSAAIVEEAFQAVAQAASAARAAASAASEAQARVAALESQVAQLQADAARNREQAAALRARMADNDRAARSWLPWLAVVLLGMLSGWLGWRLRAAQQERDRAWRQAAAMPEPPRPPTAASQLPMVTSEIMVPPPPPPYPRRAAHVPAAGAGFAPTVTQPAPPPEPDTLPGPPVVERTDIIAHGSDKGSPRDVSIEELLDLEQQAEFFIVLGQEEAAIDLLVDHLRDTGGGSPLPYLKLLEIYRRRGDRDAYERTRARFNHRFNAYAPDWDSDLQHGRSLDDYAGVVPRLQQVWPRPLDAMAELEALLFRKSRGDLFDLPAYREVLFLYSLARDLLDREAADTGNVDLLLPLADGGEFSSTSPHPYFGLERESVFDSLTIEDRPTAPVDLDLTQPEPQPVIEKPARPRR
jgi:pilus assembly protein FimV